MQPKEQHFNLGGMSSYQGEAAHMAGDDLIDDPLNPAQS